MKSLQRVPESIQNVQESYDRLYQGWLGDHRNIDQAGRILNLLQVQPGKHLVDIACGLGYLADMAAARGLQALGIDVSIVALQQARRESAHAGMFVLGAAESLPWPSKSMDYVACLGSLEHFVDPAAAVQEMTRILKDDGRAALLVPNSHHIRAIYNVYKYGEILDDLQDYERYATRGEWERLFTSCGLRIVSVHKYDMGMARVHKKGREGFWYAYNILFKLLGGRWIPLNLTYTFIFICEPVTEGK